jgi:hypothetical protein
MLVSASVTISGTTTFAALDGGPDDQDHVVNGIFTVNGDLIVNGSITCNDTGGSSSACAMSFNVSHDLIINAGGALYAENRTGSGTGGAITLAVGHDFVMHSASGTSGPAIVSSDAKNSSASSGGAITANVANATTIESGATIDAGAANAAGGKITITGGGHISIDGNVLSGPGRTLLATRLTGQALDGGSANQSGGEIRIVSNSFLEPSMNISSNANIVSQGETNGSGPVTIQGCGVEIRGLVASLAKKDASARVDIRSGKTLIIDSRDLGIANATQGRLGHIRVDAPTGTANHHTLDLFAGGAIQVLGPLGSPLYALSAIPGVHDAKSDGGTIHVISTGQGVTASGNVSTSGFTASGDGGGTVEIAAQGDLNLDTAQLHVVGDANTNNTNRNGGVIHIRSYSGNVIWTNGVGDVTPTGSQIPAALQGSITITACGTITTSGSSFPTNGAPVGTFPATTTGSCTPAAPSLPADEPALPICNNPPVADNVTASTLEDHGVTVTMTGSDPDGNSLTFSILTQPANGTLGPIHDATSTSAQVDYTPNADYNGSDSFTFKVDDGSGGTAIGTATITITAVNDAPLFTAGTSPQTSLEDAGPQFVFPWASGIAPGPANESSQHVTFVITNNSNSSLFSFGPAVSPSGALSYTAAADANGTASLSVVAMDDGGTANGGVDTSAPQNFTINVTAVNDAPSFTKGADQTVLEDSGAHTVAGWATNISAGPANESGQTLAFAVTNDNSGLFSVQPAIDPVSGNLTYTLSPDGNGSAAVHVTLKDNGGTADGGVDTSAEQLFFIHVTPVNDPPNFTKGADQTVLEDSGAHTVANWATNIVAGPGDEQASQMVTFATSNDNNTLFSAQPSVDASGNLTFTVAADAFGTATVSVVAHDNGGTANGGSDTSAAQTFTITVTAVNDAPSFTKGGDVTVNEDSGAYSQANWATAISPGPNESSQTVSFTVINNNNALFSAQPAVNASGTLTFTPSPNANGTVTVSITAHDDGGTANGGVDTSAAQTFTITVTAVNDAPSFTGGGNVSVLEDSGAYSQAWATAISAGPPDESSQSVTFTTSNSNNALFSAQPSVDASGNLTFTVAPDAFGTVTVSVIAHDNGGTANGGVDTSAAQTFTITVTAVNDPPSFTKGPDVSVSSDAGAQSFVNWATNISPGPANESAQTVSFLVSNDNNAAFAAQPAVNSAGTLSFTTSVSAPTTTVHVSVAAHDNGGTANGGVDTSAAQSFNINVTHANQPPNAVNDSFDAVGNTELAVGTSGSQGATLSATGSLLANDSDPDGDPIAAALGTASAGASVTVNADGSFTYLPPSGFTGADTFTYTVSDDHGHTSTATVTVHVTKRVLYVKNDGGGSTGRVDSPYTTLAAAQVASADNDTVYVFTGDGTTGGQSNGVTLNHNGERLIGEGVALKASGIYNGVTNPQLRAAGAAPKMSNVAGAGVTITGSGTLSNNEVSGVEITTATNAGVSIGNAANVTMDGDKIDASTNSGVRGTAVNGFSFTNGTILSSGSVSGDGNLSFDNLTGSASVSNSTFAGAFSDNIRVANTSGSLNRLTLTNVTLNGNSTTTGNTAVNLTANNGTTLNVTVTGSHFNSTRSQHFQLSMNGTVTSDVVFTGNTIANVQTALSGGGGVLLATGGGSGAVPTLTYDISNNSIRNAVGAAISVAKGSGTGSATGTISGNTIGVTGVTDSGSSQGDGVAVTHVGGGSTSTTITNNAIAQYNNNGISLQIGDHTTGNGSMLAIVQSNTVSNPGSVALNGFLLNAGTSSGDAHTVCLKFGGSGAAANSITGAGSAPNGGFDARLRQRMATTVRLAGYVGANNDNAAVQTYVQSQNGGTPTVSASSSVPTGGGFVGGTCP